MEKSSVFCSCLKLQHAPIATIAPNAVIMVKHSSRFCGLW